MITRLVLTLLVGLVGIGFLLSSGPTIEGLTDNNDLEGRDFVPGN